MNKWGSKKSWEEHHDKWEPEPNTGCYLWTGASSGRGRPIMRNPHDCNKMTNASRVILWMAKGAPINHGDEASHLCGVDSCVNPDHLMWESHKNNMLRVDLNTRMSSSRKASSVSANNRRKYC